MSQKPSFDIIEFYIDPIVDKLNPLLKEKLLINPIDEPLLSLVFENKLIKKINLRNHKKINAIIPNPEALLAMKFNSVDDRTKDHKRIKDITDIFALIWYSDLELDEIRDKISALKNIKEMEKTISRFKDSELKQVSNIINYDLEDMKNIFKTFIKQ